MPRRNRPYRRPLRAPEPEATSTRAPSFEAMARELVKAGKCSPLILEHPMHNLTERRNHA